MPKSLFQRLAEAKKGNKPTKSKKKDAKKEESTEG
jgi:hypothetical protein|tara:strand:- start:16 stop:120 length:105 start_codon:yes stop_codon:yes gene_type:complete